MWEDGALCPGYANNINSCVDETLDAYRLAQYNISSSAAGKFPYCLKLLPCQYMYKYCGAVPEKNTFPISYMNEGTGTEHFRSTMQKESQFLLLCCCCCWSSFTTLLHFIPSTKFTFVVKEIIIYGYRLQFEVS